MSRLVSVPPYSGIEDVLHAGAKGVSCVERRGALTYFPASFLKERGG
jgi:hypothetical protein